MDDHRFALADCQFTIPETCKHLKISRSYLYELFRTKQIKKKKLGSRTIVPGAEIQRFVKVVADCAC